MPPIINRNAIIIGKKPIKKAKKRVDVGKKGEEEKEEERG